jgi:hypothetical protein
MSGATYEETILELVREFQSGGGFYDDEALKFVAARLGVEPTRGLGSEIYRAKGVLSDEAAQEQLEALLADGFVSLDGFDLADGERYTVRSGTLYVGRSVPTFGRPVSVRGRTSPHGRVGFVLKGARNFVHIATPAVIRKGWDG